MDDKDDVAFKTALATFTALRSEILARISGQARAAAGAVALVTGFIGVLAAVRVEKESSLIVTLLAGNADSLEAFAVLCAGFVLGIELLLSFWAYQLFQIFRLSLLLMRLDDRLKERFSVVQEESLIGWEREGRGMKDVNIDPRQTAVALSVRIVSYAQPLIFFSLGTLGLIGMLLGASQWNGVLFVLIFMALVVGLLGNGAIMFSLHKWMCGGYRPDWALGVKSAPDSVDSCTSNLERKREEQQL